MNEKKRILILYDHHEIHVKTIADYLHSFHRFSRHDVSYVSSFAKCHFDLDYFDAVVVHYSVRMCYPGPLSKSFARAIARYRGLKVLFIQDEYENTGFTHQSILDLGFGLIFTCVPPESVAKVYPRERFGHIKFVTVLTGYVPINLTRLSAFAPIRQRKILIGYRGRNLGYWLGDLGQEKQAIGQRMKQVCDPRGLVTDIAWNEEDRIYDGWFDFLGRCKATLGTESGANIFDFDGTLRPTIEAELRHNPTLSYDEVRRKYLQGREGEVVMNQISPKIFEAIACRTALVLFEGRYSSVLEPGTHFISLKKDFSNVDEVLTKLQDDAYLEALTERAHAEIIGSARYTYQAFVREVDTALDASWAPMERVEPAWLPLPPCDALPAFCGAYQKNFQAHAMKRAWRAMPGFVRALVSREKLKRVWLAIPGPIRSFCRPILEGLRALTKTAH